MLAKGKGHYMAQSTYENITLTAPDMSCGHCEMAVQNRLGALDGVSQVKASSETKHVELSFDPSKVTLDTIKAELDDEGYPVAE
jgi:copper chaperone